jgi:hypothetical protein
MAASKDRNFLEASMHVMEAGVDFGTENELVKAIPIVGTAFKIAKGLDDIRNRTLIAKLTRFLSDPSLASAKAGLQLQELLRSDEDTQYRIGEALFLTIERVTDLEKPTMLAKVFAAYLGGLISAESVRRLAHAIDMAFCDDLRKLLEANEELEEGKGNDWKRALVPAGFAYAQQGVTWEDSGRTRFVLTHLAEELRISVLQTSS